MRLFEGLVAAAAITATAVAVAKVIMDDLEKRRELDEFLIPSQDEFIEIEVTSDEEKEEKPEDEKEEETNEESVSDQEE